MRLRTGQAVLSKEAEDPIYLLGRQAKLRSKYPEGPCGGTSMWRAEQWRSQDKLRLCSEALSWNLASVLTSCVILDRYLPSLSLSVLICK